MYSKIKHKLLRTVTLRLTLWYVVLFGALSLVVFLIVYMSLTTHLAKRLDASLRDEATEFESLYKSHGVKALQAEFQREAKSQGTNRVFFRLLSPELKVIITSPPEHWKGLKNDKTLLKMAAESPNISTMKIPGHHYRVRVISKKTYNGSILQIGMTMKYNDLLMAKYRETFGIAIAVMLISGGLVGWLMAKHAMSGVQRVTGIVSQIGGADLDRRVPLKDEGLEIDELAKAFNKMLERIQSLVNELKEVTNNIAHDMRSPITRIRGIAETTLTGEQDITSYRDMTIEVIEESDRLITLINTMLEIAQAHSGVVASINKQRIDIRQVLREAVELFMPVAEDKGLRIEANIPNRPVITVGDITKIQRIIANLLDNAIKYTSEGKVNISVSNTEDRIKIKIQDTGIGIEPQDISKIFDRFYRGDKSRSSQGNGLGLSLALAFAQIHGGDIQVSSVPGKGSVFTLLLPVCHQN